MANLYTSVADDIEQKIRVGQWQIGEKLPAERALAEQYAVSRSVIREALKALEEKNLIDIYVGKGAFVTRPTEENLKETLETALDTHCVKLLDVVDTREVLEYAIGKLAIEKADREDLEELNVLYEKMAESIQNGILFAEYDTKFHLKLAECAGNAVLKIFIQAINSVIDRRAILDSYNGMIIRERAQIEHKAMLMALEYRKEKDFCDAVGRHMRCIRQQIEESERKR